MTFVTLGTWSRQVPAGLKDLMTRMGHDNVRAAMIYQHAVRGADKVIAVAIDKHLIGHGDTRSDQLGTPIGAHERARDLARDQEGNDEETAPDMLIPAD